MAGIRNDNEGHHVSSAANAVMAPSVLDDPSAGGYQDLDDIMYAPSNFEMIRTFDNGATLNVGTGDLYYTQDKTTNAAQ